MKTPTKEQVITLLYAFAAQRPGLDFGNYGDVTSYRSESRRITRQGHEARQLIRAVELAQGMTVETLLGGFRAYSGRLSILSRLRNTGTEKCGSCGARPGKLHSVDCKGDDHTPTETVWALDYCTGQYWPTEYRAAVCAVCASALWDYYREDFAKAANPGESPGDAIRRKFRRQFGAAMQRRWFD
jgi:hypothetical protein